MRERSHDRPSGVRRALPLQNYWVRGIGAEHAFTTFCVADNDEEFVCRDFPPGDGYAMDVGLLRLPLCEASMQTVTTISLEIAKSAFQIRGLDPEPLATFSLWGAGERLFPNLGGAALLNWYY